MIVEGCRTQEQMLFVLCCFMNKGLLPEYFELINTILDANLGNFAPNSHRVIHQRHSVRFALLHQRIDAKVVLKIIWRE